MRKTPWSAVVLLVFTISGQAVAAEATFIAPGHLDLTRLLAPPPAPGSAEQQRDLAEVLAVQKARTSAQSQRAMADATAGNFGFADVLGTNFNAQQVPKVAALLEQVRGDAVVLMAAGKQAWNRPRPFQVSNDVDPLGERPGDSSYPSGASISGYLIAIVLADMVPEKRAALFARGREFGDDRVIMGIHFPTDVESGRLAASAIAATLFENQAFLAEFAQAKSELRQALGLHPA